MERGGHSGKVNMAPKAVDVNTWSVDNESWVIQGEYPIDSSTMNYYIV